MRTGAVSTIVFWLLVWLVLEIIIPRYFLRPLVLSTAHWASNRRETVARHFFGEYLQYALLSDIAAREGRPSTLNDTASELVTLRRNFDDRRVSRVWPPLLTGTGSCDQINGAAAELLAHDFGHSQIVGIVDPRTGISPHTIGRFRERGVWTWFDCFYGRVVLFKVNSGAVQPLASIQTPGIVPRAEDEALADSFYRLVAGGHWFVLRRYGGTLPESIWLALDDHMKSSGRRPRRTSDVASAAPAARTASKAPAFAPGHDPSAMRRFLAARYDALLPHRQ